MTYIVGPDPVQPEPALLSAATWRELREIEAAIREMAQGAESALVPITDFQTGWAVYPNASFPDLGYYLNGERVFIQGAAIAVSGVTLNTPVVNLPLDARPGNTIILDALGFSNSTGETHCRIDIRPDGDIVLNDFGGALLGAGSWIGFNNITYRRDASFTP